MFERFSERARQVVVLAQDESRQLGQPWIGTDHLLLGVIREEGVASEALKAAGLSLDAARAAVVALTGSGGYVVSGQIPFTLQAKHALETTLVELIRLEGNAITAELVLLGVLMQRSGSAACVLRDCGIDTGKVIAALDLGGKVDLALVQPADDAAPERTRDDPVPNQPAVPRGRSLKMGEGLFARFTERARQVVVLAQDEARGLNHNYIGTEHILLGLLDEEEGLAARVLESLHVTVEEVRAQVARIVGQSDEVSTGRIPFTPRSKKVLELALREALAIGHNYIGTEHILLGLVRENEGVAARILLDFDLDAEKIRGEVIRMLGGPGRRSQASAGSPISRMSTFSVPESDPPPLEPIDDPTRALTVGELVDSVSAAKEMAIASREFEWAAELRGLEHRLIALIKSIARIVDREA